MADLVLKHKDVTSYILMTSGNPNIVTLESDVTHEFNLIHIGTGCTLTVEAWKGRQEYRTLQRYRSMPATQKHSDITAEKIEFICAHWNEHKAPLIDVQQMIGIFVSSNYTAFRGGTLMLRCSTLIVEAGGKIDATGCGYLSGTYHTSGESLTNVGKLKSRQPNFGGGGAAVDTVNGAGGAGYGSVGGDGQHERGGAETHGLGGGTYGDKALSRLHLGSGGGGGLSESGGNGGGAIYIVSDALRCDGSITANGGDAQDGTGAGSGGSIHIISFKSFEVGDKGLIQARGGKGGKWALYGNGGHGRIRVDVQKQLQIKLKQSLQRKRIQPLPFTTSL